MNVGEGSGGGKVIGDANQLRVGKFAFDLDWCH